MDTFNFNIDLPSQGQIWEYLAYSDPHWGAAACDEQLFRRTLKRYGKRDHCYFIGLGDELNAIPVRDDRFTLSGLAARIAIDTDGGLRDDIITEQIRDYAKMFGRYVPKKRDLGHTSGNHPAKLASRTSTYDASEQLCLVMDRPWLGYSWLYRVDVSVRGKPRIKHFLSGHHGFGGGSGLTADKNRYVRYASGQRGVDIAFFGHSHKRWFEETMAFDVSARGPARIVPQRKLIINCGTFLKTYSNRRQPTYSEMKGYHPIVLGCQLVRNKIIEINGIERIYSWVLPAEAPDV